MKKEKRMNDDFTTGSIPKKLTKFMVPVLLALILQAMYGAVDLLVVGHFGSFEGISAVATGSNIIHFVTITVTGLTMGITVLISRYIGEKRNERVGKVIGTAICFFFALGIFLSLLLLFFAEGVAALMQTPKDAYPLTVQYIRICGGGMIFIVAYNVISGIFRGLGNSRLPLVFVAIACVVNIAGDFLFVAVFGWDVAGAALATVLAQVVSVILSLIIICRQKLPFTVKRSDIRFSKEIKRFFQIGGPICLQDMLTSASFLVLCAVINNISLEASSGYGVAQKVVAFIMLIPAALMQSMSAFVAQNVGAGNLKRAKQAMFYGIGIGAFIGVFVTVFIFFRGDLAAMVFTKEPLYIEKAFEYLRGFSIEAVITCILFGMMGYFNGNSRTLFVMIQGVLQSILIRIPVSYFMSLREGVTLTEIGIAVPVSTVFGIILCVIYYICINKKSNKRQLTEGLR